MGRLYSRPETGRHYYRRPDWTCLACREPWPCATRRAAFLEKFAGEGLRLRGIMGALMLDAERDLRLTRDEAHERFGAWTLTPGEDEPERAERSASAPR